MFHVYARGNNKRLIYLDDADRRQYLTLLSKTIQRRHWNCLSYCLMDNHVHLLLETPEPNLGAGMQQLHGEYARRFNDRYSLSGHLFQGRYGAELMRDESQVVTVVRYIALNPVEAKICRRPGDYMWSSYAETVAGSSALINRNRLVWLLGASGPAPGEIYARLIEDVLWE